MRGVAWILLGLFVMPTVWAQTPRTAVEAVVGEVIVPGYQAFAERSEDLHQRLEAYCAAPDADTLAQARSAWREAMAAWQRVSFLRFGPARHGTPAIEWRIDSHLMPGGRRPDSMRRGIAQAIAAKGLDLTAELLEQQNVFGRGLPALECLLFDDAAQRQLAEDERSCDYLEAAGGDLLHQARTLEAQWTEQAPETHLVADGAPPLDTLVNALIGAVDGIKRVKLEGPIRRGKLDPGDLESRLSGASLDNIGANLAGIDAVLGPVGGDRLLALVAAGDSALAERIAADLATAQSATAAIKPPLATAYTDDAQHIEAALAALTVLHHDLRLDLVRALGVRPAFNEADGD